MSVTLDHVTRTVDGMPTIRDVSLTLESGTLSVLLGPTLSGKTSIMRLLAGLDKPTTGRVLVDGKDVTGVDVRQRSVAMVYQQFINYPSLTVYENIASPLRVQGRPSEEIERRVAEAARLLRLEPFLKRTPLQLSGGQQQRTAIARALVKGADLVLLDEPLANLDYKLREELRTELPRIFEASGAIFVYATTEPSEALLLGGNTVCMWEGQALQAGETAEGLSPSRYAARGAGVLRSAAQRRRHREEERLGAICRRHQGAGHRALCQARRRRLSRRLPRPSARNRQRPGRPPRLPRHRDGDRDHRFGKFRASEPRRLRTGSRCCTACMSTSRASSSMPCSIPTMSSCSMRPTAWSPRRARKRGRCDMARIDLVDLAHSYGGNDAPTESFALKPVTMTWRQGGAYALLGPSGCGKTTLLNLISGIVTPSRGKILFDGADITPLSTQKRNIAQVFQFPVIYDTMTVGQNLAFPLKNRGVPKAEIDTRVAEIAACSISRPISSRKATRLTADAKQKISLGRGLVRSDVAACCSTSR